MGDSALEQKPFDAYEPLCKRERERKKTVTERERDVKVLTFPEQISDGFFSRGHGVSPGR